VRVGPESRRRRRRPWRASRQAVASSLRISEAVQVLCFRDNCIGERGCADLLEALRHKAGGVHTLDLSHNQIGARGAAALEHVMGSLTSLDVGGNRLGNGPVQALMGAVGRRAGRLRRLQLRDNAISSAAGTAIAGFLRATTSLEQLGLSWNAIRGRGASAIGDAVAVNDSLTALNLDWNGFGGGGGGFDSWADVFERNSRLTDLSFRHNNLDERDAVIISENIRQNETIERLDLSENPLGPIGGKLVFKLMDSFGASRALIMENCNFDARSRHCNFDLANPQGRFEPAGLGRYVDGCILQFIFVF
jgi:Ran GTPase-activating protein (RanGAP) involved in mRNA processing and transport